MGANINLQDDNGWTCLLYACYSDKLDLFKILIDKNANLNLEDCYGQSVLLYACYKNIPEIISYLLEYL